MSQHTDLAAFIGLVRRRYVDGIGVRTMTTEDMTIADAILDDPERFILLLVKAGVLDETDCSVFGRRHYELVENKPNRYQILHPDGVAAANAVPWTNEDYVTDVIQAYLAASGERA